MKKAGGQCLLRRTRDRRGSEGVTCSACSRRACHAGVASRPDERLSSAFYGQPGENEPGKGC